MLGCLSVGVTWVMPGSIIDLLFLCGLVGSVIDFLKAWKDIEVDSCKQNR